MKNTWTCSFFSLRPGSFVWAFGVPPPPTPFFTEPARLLVFQNRFHANLTTMIMHYVFVETEQYFVEKYSIFVQNHWPNPSRRTIKCYKGKRHLLLATRKNTFVRHPLYISAFYLLSFSCDDHYLCIAFANSLPFAKEHKNFRSAIFTYFWSSLGNYPSPPSWRNTNVTHSKLPAFSFK